MERFSGGVRYSNQYGEVELSFATGLMNVADMQPMSEHLITLEDAENVAVITGNRNIQIGIIDRERCYVVFHESPSTGYVCKVNSINLSPLMDNRTARDIIEDSFRGGIDW